MQTLEALMRDKNIDETDAAKLFFASDIFIKLSDKETELYPKPWQEIYEMLKIELKM